MKIALFNDTSITQHYGCTIVMENLESLLKHQGIEISYMWPVGYDWRTRINDLKNISDVDAIIVNGEGSIHHSDSRDRAVYLSQLAEFSHTELEKPAYLINSTIASNTKETYTDLQKFNKIYVRESMSESELNTHNITAQITPDLSMAEPFKNIKTRSGILVVDSVFKELSNKLSLFSKDNGYDFVSMQPNNQLIKRIFRKLKRLTIDKAFLPITNQVTFVDYKKYLNLLSSKELVITGRFHTVTLCLLTKTPFVAIESNTNKISAILIDVFGNNKRVISSEDLLTGQIDLSLYAKWSKTEEEQVDSYLKSAQNKAQNMIKEIAQQITELKK